MSSPDVSITVCPNGPLLVRGPAELRDADGGVVDHERNVIALCRCGRSALKPLCDGSHRRSRFRDDQAAAAMSQTLRTGRLPEDQPDPSDPTALSNPTHQKNDHPQDDEGDAR